MNLPISQPESNDCHGGNDDIRQFVILEHDFPFLHWDYLIEDGEMLASWRLMVAPGNGISALATRIGDHRRHYLTYEGPVSGNRGAVRRVQAGLLKPDVAWPACNAWHDVRFAILESDLSEHCTLTKQDNTEVWSFF